MTIKYLRFLLFSLVFFFSVIPSVNAAHKCAGLYQLIGTYYGSIPGTGDLVGSMQVEDDGSLILLVTSVYSGNVYVGSPIPANGVFDYVITNGYGTRVRGTCSSVLMKGTFSEYNQSGFVGSGSYIGRKMTRSGPYQSSAGFYQGPVSGNTIYGKQTGSVYAMVYPDGLFHAFTVASIPNVVENGTDAAIYPLDEAGRFAGKSYGDATFSIALNTSNKTMSGSYTLPSVGSGTLSLSRVRTLSPSPSYKHGDFNQDGMADVLWRNTQTGQVYIYLMNGANIVQSFPLVIVNNDWDIISLSDFNNDYKTDILWRNNKTGTVWVYLMNDTAIDLSREVAKVTDLNWKIVKVLDYNGDGNADIFWRHQITGENWVYLMNAEKIQQSRRVNTIPSQSWQVVD